MENEDGLRIDYGLTYTEGPDGLLYPDLILDDEQEPREILKYGVMRRDYLKNHRKNLYTALLMKGCLNTHLADVQDETRERVHQLMEQMKKIDPPPPQGTMEWVGYMNNLEARAEEIVFPETIYS